MKFVKAKLYQINIYEGVMDFIHGGGRDIRELVFEQTDNYLEAVNVVNGTINCFHTDTERYSKAKLIRVVDIPIEIYYGVRDIIRSKMEMEQHKESLEKLTSI